MGMIEFHIKKLFWRVRNFRRYFWPLVGFVSISIIIILTLKGGDVSTFPVGWEKSFPVTPYGMSVKNIRMTSSGNYITAVYEAVDNKKSGIYISISFDGGAKFFKPIVIAQVSSEIEMNPHAAISSGGHIAVVWQSLVKGDPESRINYSISADMGATWSEPRRINLSNEMTMLPQLMYDHRGGLHVFYSAYKDKAFNLFHVSSADEKTFTPPKRLVNIKDLRGVFFPAVCSSGQDIYMVIQGKGEESGELSDNLYFIMSDDNGDSWSSSRRITFSKAQDSSPYITVFKNIIYLVYQNNQEGSWSIKLLRGYEKGERWDRDPVKISATNADCFSPVAVNSDEEKMTVLWYDIREKNPAIFSRKFSITVGKLDGEQRLSRSNVSARKPSAVSMGKSVIVLWEEAGTVMAKSSDVYAAPPAVYSETHPEDEWSKSSKAIIKWKAPDDESKIVGYATMIKRASDYKLPDPTPNVQNVNGNINNMMIPDLEDGVSYFYIRAIDGAGNYSRTVRYKIQVSSEAPPMPVVTSPTHPEATGVESNSPEFDWAVDRKVGIRLKGYLYNLSKNTTNAPKIFTTESQMKFYDLETGRYFFSVRSVDKTNTLSRTATYEIIVGSAPEIDASLYGKIAKRIEEEPSEIKELPVKKPVKRIIMVPSIDIALPFDDSKPFSRSYFEAGILLKNINGKNVAGYSVFIDSRVQTLPDRINNKKEIINIAALKTGDYYIGAKCMYYKVVNGKKYFVWTEPVIKKFSISVPVPKSPVLAYLDNFLMRVDNSRGTVSISMMLMVFSLAAFGYGSKLVFYAKLIQLKIINIFKSF